jgi:hypothetical protein
VSQVDEHDPDALTPEETGLLLARMRQDGQVQRAQILTPEQVMPQSFDGARITAIEVQRAKFYAGVLDGEITDSATRGRKRVRAASDWINRPTFQRIIQQAMGAAGVTPERIATKVSRLMDAEETRVLLAPGGVVIREQVSDNETQLKATRLAHDMLMDSTEYAPAEREELADLANELAELTIDELERRAVALNQQSWGVAQSAHGNGPAAVRRRSRE